MKGFKAFNKDFTCNKFQFEENKTYKEKEAVTCESGFHFCKNPFDVLDYYDLCDSEFAEVKAVGIISKKENGNSKHTTTEIKIGVKVGVAGFVAAAVTFLLKHCGKKSSGDSSNSAQSGDYSNSAQSGYFSNSAQSGYFSNSAQSGDSSKSAQSGYSSNSAQSGDYSNSAQSGDSSNSAQSGDSSKSAQSGDSSKSAQSGYFSNSAQSGDYSNSAQSGYSSKSAQSGDSSKSAQSGDSSSIELNGQYSVGANIGQGGRIKGKKGCWITLAEWSYDNTENRRIPTCVKSAQIDGKKIKAGVWYALKNGVFVEDN